jgi:acyl-CoA thioesterase
MDEDELAFRVASHMRSREGAHVGTGITLDAARAGYASVALDADPSMLNSHGTVHGGVIFTLADTAFAYACNSRNDAAVAQQVSIVFLTPGRAGERLVAEAIEQSVQGRSGVYTVTVRAGARTVAVVQGLSRTIGQAVLPADRLEIS